MKFSLLETLVRAHAKELDRQNGLGGGRGDPKASALISDLETSRNELIRQHDLRPSEVESTVPNLDVSILGNFKEVIDAAKLEIVSSMSYEELSQMTNTL